MNIIEEAYHKLLFYIERYGWWVVFLLILWTFLSPYLTQLWQILETYDPAEKERRRILDESRRRVRRQQQSKIA